MPLNAAVLLTWPHGNLRILLSRVARVLSNQFWLLVIVSLDHSEIPAAVDGLDPRTQDRQLTNSNSVQGTRCCLGCYFEVDRLSLSFCKGKRGSATCPGSQR